MEAQSVSKFGNWEDVCQPAELCRRRYIPSPLLPPLMSSGAHATAFERLQVERRSYRRRTMGLPVVAFVPDHGAATAGRTPHTLGPAMLTHQGEVFGIVDQR